MDGCKQAYRADVRLVDLFGEELVESFEKLIIFAAMIGVLLDSAGVEQKDRITIILQKIIEKATNRPNANNSININKINKI